MRRLINRDIHILRPDFHRILLVVASHVSWRAGDGVAVSIEAGRDVDFAGEGQALHHHVVLAERVIEGKTRAVDFFDGERRAAGAAGGTGDDEQRGVRIEARFEFRIDGDFAADLGG